MFLDVLGHIPERSVKCLELDKTPGENNFRSSLGDEEGGIAPTFGLNVFVKWGRRPRGVVLYICRCTQDPGGPFQSSPEEDVLRDPEWVGFIFDHREENSETLRYLFCCVCLFILFCFV